MFGNHSALAVAEILEGILNVIQGNFEDLGQILVKIGAVPDSKLIYKLFKAINKYKSFLKSPKEQAEALLNQAR